MNKKLTISSLIIMASLLVGTLTITTVHAATLEVSASASVNKSKIALIEAYYNRQVAQAKKVYQTQLAGLAAQRKADIQAARENNEKGVLVGGALMVRYKNIVQNAVEANNVTTVVAAVKAAGLVATLSGPGPFTVFAPTNDAFAKLPEGTVETLLKPENKAQLTDILTYHVVPGRYLAKDLYDGEVLKTVEGKNLTVSVKGGLTLINGVTIQTSDVISSNGVTHVIDGVLLPTAQ